MTCDHLFSKHDVEVILIIKIFCTKKDSCVEGHEERGTDFTDNHMYIKLQYICNTTGV
jgi:hypothetical protein